MQTTCKHSPFLQTHSPSLIIPSFEADCLLQPPFFSLPTSSGSCSSNFFFQASSPPFILLFQPQIQWIPKILHSKYPSLNLSLYSSLQLQEIFHGKAKASPGREEGSLTGDLHISLFDSNIIPFSLHIL